MEHDPMGRFDWERIVKRLRLPPQVKYMALMLATWASEDGGDVYPGVDDLVDAMCVSKATVKRQLATLRELGLIELVSRANRYAGEADEYQLTVPVDVLEMPMLPPKNERRNKAHR